jgi:hypothetical protein
MCISLVCTSKEVMNDSKSKGGCTKGGLTFYIVFDNRRATFIQFIVLTLMIYVVGSVYYELHPMNEKIILECLCDWMMAWVV